MAILGHEALGDVHVGHDFHARDQCGMKLFGRRRFFLQQAVDAVTQLQRLLERDEMNIAGALPQRRRDDQVDEVDDRRLVGHHFDVVQVLALAGGCLVRAEIFDHLLDRDLVTFGDLFEDLR